MKKIMIIPGNPSFPEFYADFTKSLISQNSDIDVCISTHFPDFTKHMSLDDVVERHRQKMNEYQPDIIICHSMGCYIGLQIAQQKQVVMVCPAVMDMGLVKGTISDIQVAVYRTIAPYVRFVPSWFVNFMAGTEYGYKVFDKDAIECFTNLWIDERKQITDLLVPETPEKFQVICSTHDAWTPQYIRKKLKTVFTNYYETDTISHDFCIKPNECDIVAKMILPSR